MPSSWRLVAFLKSRNVQEKYLGTIYMSCLAIYRLFNVEQLNKTSNRAVTHSYKMHENRCVLLKIDMHVRPMRFTVLCTPTDSSDKTQVMCSTILLCSFDHSLIVAQPSWTAIPCPTTKLSSLISKSFVGIKQSVISIALKNKIGNLYLQICASAHRHIPGDTTHYKGCEKRPS